MDFQTIITLEKKKHNLIDYNSKIVLLGSCFSENIGKKLSYFKFQSEENPFGNLFHPKAIENLITNAINEKKYLDKDLVFNNERWHSLDAHSSLSSSNKNEVLDNLNFSLQSTFKQLKIASHIIITLGTSWVYREISSGKIVANCHKIPQKKFLKELLSVDEITENLEAIISLVKSINKKSKVVFTVSPVRHLKDGFIENQRSKSHLISAIHGVIDNRNSFYFPAYEIMMDELRDYRFYKEDMIHPNTTAINYIWGKFVNVWFSENANSTMHKVEAIQKGLTHKPFNENSKQHQQFLKKIKEKEKALLQEFPFMKF